MFEGAGKLSMLRYVGRAGTVALHREPAETCKHMQLQ